MASTVLLSFLPGLTLTLKLRLVGSQALAETVTLTESGSQAGEYSGSTALTDSDLAVGIFSGANKVADDLLTVGADAGTYRVGAKTGSTAQEVWEYATRSLTAGALTVNVLPATGIVANRTPGATLTPVVGETISQSITLYGTDGTTATNLSGKTLVIIFETLCGTDVAVVSSGSITISGASSNVVSFAYPSAVTLTERTLRFAIRDTAAPLTMYLQGLCSVVRAPQVDP